MWAQYSNRISVLRHTSVAVTTASAAATLVVARQPDAAAVLELSVAGTTGSGEATVTGVAGGTSTAETLRWTAGGVRRTVAAWTSVAGVTTSGLDDETPAPTVGGRWLSRDGTPHLVEEAVVADWPAQLRYGEQSWPNQAGTGRVEHGLAYLTIAWAEHWAPREGDAITDDLGQRWHVIGIPRRAGTTIAQAWDCRVQRIEAR